LLQAAIAGMLFVLLIKTATPGIQDLLDIQVAASGYKVIALLKELSVLALI
jgi:hypothetical protein